MSGAVIGFVLFVFALLGVPLFVIMGLGALAAFSLVQVDTSAIAVEMYRIASSPTLLPIPLFTFAGYLMAESKSPQRLLQLTQSLCSWMPGGVAIVSLIICAFFTAFTGASGVTIIALGGLLYPILMKEGYSDKFSLGLLTTSGSLGLLFPPSLPIILYGIIARVDIDKLFLAGILPGILIIVVLSFWAIYKNPKVQSFAPSEKLSVKKALWEARYEIPIPIIIIGGLYGGILTATDASVITVIYVFIMEVFLYKDLSIKKDLPRIIRESMGLVGAILIILCCALGLTNFLVDEEIPMKILDLMREHITSKTSFLLFLNLFLLIVGALMDIFSAIIVVVPLILPIAAEFGVDPIHLAMIFLVNLEIGYITPPVGINLFISSFRFDRPLSQVYRASVPYLILLLITLFIITYIPQISLVFVN